MGSTDFFIFLFFNIFGSKKTIDELGGVHPRITAKEPTAEAAKKSGIPYTVIWANLFGAYAEMALGRQLPMQNDEIDDYGTDKKSEALTPWTVQNISDWLSMPFKSACMIAKCLVLL
jgi:hypothetical protein